MKTAEDALLEKIFPLLPAGRDVVLGPGDDCAAVRVRGSRDLLLLKTDCIAENVHFLRSHDPARVGWKALCRPLSDVAAMGGIPREALVTIFSPTDVAEDYWLRFYKGVAKAARRFGVSVVGGELSRQPRGIAVSVALTGTVPPRELVARSGGKSGDLLFVTGRLGGSMGGHHLDFVPRLAEGRWLAKMMRPSAMMDLSDGLGSDLPRLARLSGCTFEINEISVPCRRGCSIAQALGDGEDYELLFAMPPRRAIGLAAVWKNAFPRTPLTCIGRLVPGSGIPDNWFGGWDHFAVDRPQPARQPRRKA